MRASTAVKLALMVAGTSMVITYCAGQDIETLDPKDINRNPPQKAENETDPSDPVTGTQSAGGGGGFHYVHSYYFGGGSSSSPSSALTSPAGKTAPTSTVTSARGGFGATGGGGGGSS